MAISEIDLFHGVVLAKLLRKRPESLKLFEFDSDKSSAAYQINVADYLYVKYSKTPRNRKYKDYRCVWIFGFNLNHLMEIRSLKNPAEVYTVLVCGDSSISNIKKMNICFLLPEDLSKCIDINNDDQQTITVADKKDGSLRVWGTKNGSSDPIIIPRNSFDKWDVPGQ
jgi:hypothetical protein